MHIHAKIKIGFQKREDTFSGKLGFIIPESACDLSNFNQWIDKKIPVKILENTPTKGFIFNKNISRRFHYSTSNKMRVYHPLGFEFEIPMENLSFILANSDINAQEIQQECVISWHRGSVYLLPVNTEEYVKLQKDIIKNNLISTLPVGDIFDCGGKKQLMYMGFLDTNLLEYYNSSSFADKTLSTVKKHIFYSLKNNNFISFEKINSIVSCSNVDKHHKKVDELLEQYNNLQQLNIVRRQIITPDFIAQPFSSKFCSKYQNSNLSLDKLTKAFSNLLREIEMFFCNQQKSLSGFRIHLIEDCYFIENKDQYLKHNKIPLFSLSDVQAVLSKFDEKSLYEFLNKSFTQLFLNHQFYYFIFSNQNKTKIFRSSLINTTYPHEQKNILDIDLGLSNNILL